jgi:hypothetical protein
MRITVRIGQKSIDIQLNRSYIEVDGALDFSQVNQNLINGWFRVNLIESQPPVAL